MRKNRNKQTAKEKKEMADIDRIIKENTERKPHTDPRIEKMIAALNEIVEECKERITDIEEAVYTLESL